MHETLIRYAPLVLGLTAVWLVYVISGRSPKKRAGKVSKLLAELRAISPPCDNCEATGRISWLGEPGGRICNKCLGTGFKPFDANAERALLKIAKVTKADLKSANPEEALKLIEALNPGGSSTVSGCTFPDADQLREDFRKATERFKEERAAMAKEVFSTPTKAEVEANFQKALEAYGPHLKPSDVANNPTLLQSLNTAILLSDPKMSDGPLAFKAPEKGLVAQWRSHRWDGLTLKCVNCGMPKRDFEMMYGRSPCVKTHDFPDPVANSRCMSCGVMRNSDHHKVHGDRCPGPDRPYFRLPKLKINDPIDMTGGSVLKDVEPSEGVDGIKVRGKFAYTGNSPVAIGEVVAFHHAGTFDVKLYGSGNPAPFQNVDQVRDFVMEEARKILEENEVAKWCIACRPEFARVVEEAYRGDLLLCGRDVSIRVDYRMEDPIKLWHRRLLNEDGIRNFF